MKFWLKTGTLKKQPEASTSVSETSIFGDETAAPLNSNIKT